MRFKMLQKMFLIAAALLLLVLQSSTCKAVQDYFEDTVWVKKTTQMEGFYQVKFSNTDSIIVAHSYQGAIFYNTYTGEEIKGIPFNAEVHFFNGDENFMQLAPSRDRLIIYNARNFEAIDTLEYDTLPVGDIVISKDENYVSGAVNNGIRTWNLKTKKIIKTVIFPAEEYLKETIITLESLCDNENFLASIFKRYYNPYPPNHEIYKRFYTTYSYLKIDSISSYEGTGFCRISNNCEILAKNIWDSDYGVDLINFKTGELKQKLPIDGNSLTGIEFSPDDKYVVTSNGPDGNSLIVWNTVSGEKAYSYFYGSYSNIDVSNNGKYIVSSTGKYLFLWNFKNETSIVENEVENNLKNIYPNPTNSIATIEFKLKNTGITKIELTNTQGDILKTILNKLLEAGIQKFEFKTDEIPSGTYFVVIQSEQEKIVFQLIVNH